MNLETYLEKLFDLSTSNKISSQLTPELLTYVSFEKHLSDLQHLKHIGKYNFKYVLSADGKEFQKLLIEKI